VASLRKLPVLSLHLVGSASMTLPDGSTLTATRGPTRFGLLLLLAFTDGRQMERERLIDLLWYVKLDKKLRKKVRTRLRVLLLKLRGQGVPFGGSDEVVQLSSALEIRIDNTAVDGDLFGGWDGEPISTPFQEWLADERSRLLVRVLEPRIRALDAAKASGNHTLVVEAAQAVLALDPLNQDGVIAMAEALIYTGSKQAALDFMKAKDIDLDDNQWTGPAWNALKRRLQAVTARPRVASREAPLVGRDALLIDLGRIFAASQHDARRVGAVITGASGIGKSTVCSAAVDHAVRFGKRISIAVRCLESEQQQPLAVLFRLLADLIETPGAAGGSPDSFALLHDMRAGRSWLGGDRRAEEAFLKASCVDILAAIGAERPLVIAVDDAQWMDASSFGVISGLIELASSERVEWLIAQRPSSTPWPHLLERFEVGPLDTGSARIVYRAWRGTDAETPEEREAVNSAGGHPLWLRALAQGAAHDHALDAGMSVTDVLGHEMAQFDADVIDLLQYVTLLGPLATVSRLAVLFRNRPPKNFQQALRFAHGQGLVNDDGSGIVVHDLWRHAVLARLSSLERQAAHYEVLDLLMSDALDSSDDTLRLRGIIEHAAAAGAPGRAAGAGVLLAERWVSSGCSPEQLGTLTMLAAARDISPDDYLRLVERTALLMHLQTDHGQMLEHGPAVLDRLRRMGRQSVLVECLIELSRLFVHGHHTGAPLGPGLDTVVTADATYPEFTRLAVLHAGLRLRSNDPRQHHGDSGMWCRILDSLATQRHTKQYAEAMMLAGVETFDRERAHVGMAALERFVSATPGNVPASFAMRGYRWLGLGHHHLGEPADALRCLTRSVVMSLALEEPHATDAIGNTHDHIGGELVHSGHFREAAMVIDALSSRLAARGEPTWRSLPRDGQGLWTARTHGWEPGLGIALWSGDLDIVEQQLATHYPEGLLWSKPTATQSPLYLSAHVGFAVAAAALRGTLTDAMRAPIQHWCATWTEWVRAGKGLNREGVYYQLVTGALALGLTDDAAALLDGVLAMRRGLPSTFPFAAMRASLPHGRDAVAFTYGTARPTRPFAEVYGVPALPSVLLDIAHVAPVSPVPAA
jgi:DNA-binding SARP family transcriptional activator